VDAEGRALEETIRPTGYERRLVDEFTLPFGDVLLLIESDRYASKALRLTVGPGERPIDLRTELTRAPAGPTILVEDPDHRTLSTASIRLYHVDDLAAWCDHPGARDLLTGEEGRRRIDRISPSAFWLVATAPGFAPTVERFTPIAREEHVVRLARGVDVAVTVTGPGGAFPPHTRLRVTGPDGVPLVDDWYPPFPTSRPESRSVLTLPEGACTVEATAPGFVTASASLTATPGAELTITLSAD
jgi:hypothetical protein